MVILTDKCKRDFDYWLGKHPEYSKVIITREAGEWNHGGVVELSIEDIFEQLPPILQNVLINDFFNEIQFITPIPQNLLPASLRLLNIMYNDKQGEI